MSLTLAPPRTPALPSNTIRQRPVEMHPPRLPTLAELASTGKEMRIKMPLEQWWDYPFEGKSEWADGEAILMPPPTVRRQLIGKRLGRAMDRDLVGVESVGGSGLRAGDRIREPDVMLVEPHQVDAPIVTGVPRLVVEIVSPSSRESDRSTKAREYLDIGIPQYWLVDPVNETIEVLRSDGGVRWQRAAFLDPGHPVAVIEVAGHGAVTLRHAEIFPLTTTATGRPS